MLLKTFQILNCDVFQDFVSFLNQNLGVEAAVLTFLLRPRTTAVHLTFKPGVLEVLFVLSEV
jgi:hypothetical protein